MYEIKIIDGISYMISYLQNGPDDFDTSYEPIC